MPTVRQNASNFSPQRQRTLGSRLRKGMRLQNFKGRSTTGRASTIAILRNRSIAASEGLATAVQNAVTLVRPGRSTATHPLRRSFRMDLTMIRAFKSKQPFRRPV
jgi:hypothetical protein